MRRGSLSDTKPGLQFLFTFFIILAGFLLFQFISIITGLLIFRIPVSDAVTILENLESEDTIPFMKYIQALTSLGMFAVSAYISAWFFSKDPFDYLGLRKKSALSVIFLVVLLTLLTLPMNNYFTYLNNKLNLPDSMNWLQTYFEDKELQMERIMIKMLEGGGIIALLVNLIVIAVIPSLGEELLFRGVLQKIFIHWTRSVHIGILITSFIFASFHFQFLSLLPRFVLGIILGYLFIYTANLWIPIIMHFVNNALGVVYYHFYYIDKADKTLEKIGTPGNELIYAFLSIIIVLIIMFVIRRISREKAKKIKVNSHQN